MTQIEQSVVAASVGQRQSSAMKVIATLADQPAARCLASDEDAAMPRHIAGEVT
jgi:hypothetical protein